ncbi:hypothetical protein ACS0TY_034292 [Phlomoides rotata]
MYPFSCALMCLVLRRLISLTRHQILDKKRLVGGLVIRRTQMIPLEDNSDYSRNWQIYRQNAEQVQKSASLLPRKAIRLELLRLELKSRLKRAFQKYCA